MIGDGVFYRIMSIKSIKRHPNKGVCEQNIDTSCDDEQERMKKIKGNKM